MNNTRHTIRHKKQFIIEDITHQGQLRDTAKVSLLGVDSLWGDCTFIPADWGS